MDYHNNIALVTELNSVKELCKEFENVSCFIGEALGKDEHDRWLYGKVTASYNTKGNAKVTKILEQNGFDISKVKVNDDEFRYGGYVMQTQATKTIKLEY
ncbi:hypothetical protein ACI2JA_03435 [Alkalihalobacillus sp. NPDC078783]